MIAVLLSTATAHARKPCTEGMRDRVGTLGIEHYLCRGGSCWIQRDPFAKDDDEWAHYFSTEPVLKRVEPGRELRDGDVLVAVDGVSVTSRAAGRHLANLQPNVPVRLRIRRDGAERELVATPRLGCEEPMLTVTGERAAPRELIAPRPNFGMSLECDACGWTERGGKAVWRSMTVPRVVAVEPGGAADVAGIRAGDRVLATDGHWMFEPKDGAAIGAIRAGQKVQVRVGREDSILEVWLTAR